MIQKKGSLLEKNVEYILKNLGFNTETNVKRAGYEIDVLAEKNNFWLICECKQYENSHLTIRNLIHQWADKNLEIKANRILLVLYGVNVTETDRQLASSRKIVLWDENILQRCLNSIASDKKEAEQFLEAELGLNLTNSLTNDSESKIKNGSEAKKIIALQLLSGRDLKSINEDDLYANLIASLKGSLQETIRRKADESADKYRKTYAELFLKIEEKRSSKDKWLLIKDIIKNDIDLFPTGQIKVTHLKAIDAIEDIFNEAKLYFDESDKSKLRKKLVLAALELLRDSNIEALTFISKTRSLYDLTITFHDLKFNFYIRQVLLNSHKIEKLNWLVDGNSNSFSGNYQWSVDSSSKATKNVEAVFLEIFDEKPDFDIVLRDMYQDKSKFLLYTYVVLGIITLRFFVGFLFLFLAYKEYRKFKK